MSYIIKITDTNHDIRYYKGIKKNTSLGFGVLCDWTSNKEEAKTFLDKQAAIANAKSINGIAIVVTTEVIELAEGSNDYRTVESFSASEHKKRTIEAIDRHIEETLEVTE